MDADRIAELRRTWDALFWCRPVGGGSGTWGRATFADAHFEELLKEVERQDAALRVIAEQEASHDRH